MYPYDNRSPFERYCRQKGTRIDAIMTRLERFGVPSRQTRRKSKRKTEETMNRHD